MSQEDKSEYVIDRPICCSVNTFLCANYVWGFLSFGLLAVGVVGLAVEGGVLILLPPQAYATAIAFGGYSLLVIIAGVMGQKLRVELLFLLYVLLMALGLIAQTLGFCFVMLYANDVATISTFDNAAIDAQKTLENHLVDFAGSEASKWKSTQNRLDCCGIDFEAGLAADFDIAEVESGDRCAEGANITAQLRVDAENAEANNDDAAFDQFGNFIEARDDPIIGFAAKYFCKAEISSLVKQYTPAIATILAVILFVQLVALVAASRMYWVPEFLGGWQFDDEEMEIVAKRKGLAMPKTEYNAGGNRVLSTLRERGNRLSFRIRNAYTADPEVPASAGFLNRLSLNRNALSGHGSFKGMGGAGAAENEGAGNLDFSDMQDPYAKQATQRGGMFSRISQRLNLRSLGGHSLIDVNPNVRNSEMSQGSSNGFRPSQPAGPPPGYQNSNRSMTGRMSQRLQQGFQSMGSAISSRGGFFMNTPKPAPPPGPPMQQMSTNTVGMMNAPPPPNTFQRAPSNPALPLSPPGLGMAPPAPTPRMSPAPVPQQSYQPPAQQAPAPYKPPTQAAPAPYKPPTQSAPAPYKPPTQSAPAPAPRPTGGGRKKSKAPAGGGGGGGGGGAAGGLLAQIQAGTRLKKAVTVDKSAPKF